MERPKQSYKVLIIKGYTAEMSGTAILPRSSTFPVGVCELLGLNPRFFDCAGCDFSFALHETSEPCRGHAHYFFNSITITCWSAVPTFSTACVTGPLHNTSPDLRSFSVVFPSGVVTFSRVALKKTAT